MDFSKIKEWLIPEGKVKSVSVDGKVVWKAGGYADHLSAPTILLDGDILTITATDDRTKQFVICVDGVEKTVVDNLSTPTEGLAYTLSDDGTYYTCAGMGTATDTDIVIASEIDGVPVMNIGMYAFRNCNTLTSIVIPNSVTIIGYCAFKNCDSLTSVVIPDSVTNIRSEAFSNCDSLTNVVIGDSVTRIELETFRDCISLTNVAIGDSVTGLSSGAFKGCKALTSVVIPDSVTSIGTYAFDSCYSLSSIVIPDSVKSIEGSAFRDCSKLANIYCEAESQPSGWASTWKSGCNAVVTWGYTTI